MNKCIFSFGGGAGPKIWGRKGSVGSVLGLSGVSFASLRDEIDICFFLVFMAIPLAERRSILNGRIRHLVMC